jgi:hypothetical protein
MPRNEAVGKARYELETDPTKLKKGLDDAGRTIKATGAETEKAFAQQGTSALGKFSTGLDGVVSRFNRIAQGGGIGGALLGGVGLGAGLSAFNVVQGAISGALDKIGQGIQLASDKAEAAGKAQIVFGESYDVVAQKAQGAAEAVGMSEGAYLAAAGSVGTLVKNLGYAGDAAATMSTDVVQLAADLGSFHNASTPEAVEALGAAFRGESEPIRRFGVMLDAATVAARAVSLGLAKNAREMTNAAKAQATWSLILEQTADAQGNYALTADGWANSTKTLNAQLDDLTTDIGEALLPALVTVAGFMREDLIPAIEAAADLAGELGDVLDEIGVSLQTDPYRAQSEALELFRDELGMTAQEFAAFADLQRERGWSTWDDGATFTQNVQRELAVLRSLYEDYARDNLQSGVALTKLSGNWLEAGEAALQAGRDIAGPGGPGARTARTTARMLQSTDAALEPWKADWKALAAWAKDPFTPAKFENWLEGRQKAAIRKAKQAAEDGRPGVARRWRLIAKAMESPILESLLAVGMGVDEAIAKIQGIQALAKRIEPLAIVVTGAGGGDHRGGGLNADGTLARAMGGPLAGGQAYRVGEVGPELAVFPRDGYMLSNAAMEGLNRLGTQAAHGAVSMAGPQSGHQTVDARVRLEVDPASARALRDAGYDEGAIAGVVERQLGAVLSGAHRTAGTRYLGPVGGTI